MDGIERRCITCPMETKIRDYMNNYGYFKTAEVYYADDDERSAAKVLIKGLKKACQELGGNYEYNLTKLQKSLVGLLQL